MFILTLEVAVINMVCPFKHLVMQKNLKDNASRYSDCYIYTLVCKATLLIFHDPCNLYAYIHAWSTTKRHSRDEFWTV